ncbi:uncharacterized protein LOC132309082 [Cornus florida]|uniref:uncharacterized protein LOC132309082 n=1 Tax=Cornus florida TaxID=4283 RepID=UPI00289B52D4|nr:uncharacterized protein LOC132309082 [Cornus florida]
MREFIKDGQWDEDTLRNTTKDLVQLFRKLLIAGGEDSVQWITPFGFNAAWEAARLRNLEVEWVGLCWNRGRPRWSMHSVLVIHKAILSLDFLQKRGVALANRCYLCYTDGETLDHMFCDCDNTWQVWSFLFEVCGWTLQRVHGITDLIEQFTQHFQRQTTKKMARMIFTTSLYFLWWKRNNRLHDKCVREAKELAKCIF